MGGAAAAEPRLELRLQARLQRLDLTSTDHMFNSRSLYIEIFSDTAAAAPRVELRVQGMSPVRRSTDEGLDGLIVCSMRVCWHPAFVSRHDDGIQPGQS